MRVCVVRVVRGGADPCGQPQEFELLETDETVRGETMTPSRAPAKLRRSVGAREDGAAADNLSPQQELEAEILDKHEGSVMEKAEWDRKWLVLYLTFAFSGGYVLIGTPPSRLCVVLIDRVPCVACCVSRVADSILVWPLRVLYSGAAGYAGALVGRVCGGHRVGLVYQSVTGLRGTRHTLPLALSWVTSSRRATNAPHT
jgi:hypothetical protein